MAEGADVRVVVLMGVTGCGKTTIGEALARREGATFADADDYHSAANKAKMAAGQPLTDTDRAPWLATLHGLVVGWAEGETRWVLACSALKESYRATLGAGVAKEKLAFVWLDVPRAVLEARLKARQNSFMNPVLLDSQLATLEAPADALRVVNDRSPDAVAEEIVVGLGL